MLRERSPRYSPKVPEINVNDIELFYETAGDPRHPPLLLIAGLGVQLIDWPACFVDSLVEHGLYVISYDNRDIGLSTTFDGGQHDPFAVLDAILSGEDPDVAYTLIEMTDSAAGLLDSLGCDSAPVACVSLRARIVHTPPLHPP